MSLINDFDDHLFVSASYHLGELLSEVSARLGRKPTVEEFSELLTWGLRSCADDTFADANNQNIASVQIKLKRRGKVLQKPGDIVAIPSAQGGFHLTVFLASNRFGFAYGVLKGRHSLKPLRPGSDFGVFPVPVYSGNRNVVDGTWPVVGHGPQLLGLFPRAPELYHFPDDVSDFVQELEPDSPPLGPHGSAESPDGTLRSLSSQEAAEVRSFLDESTFIDESIISMWLDKKNSPREGNGL